MRHMSRPARMSMLPVLLRARVVRGLVLHVLVSSSTSVVPIRRRLSRTPRLPLRSFAICAGVAVSGLEMLHTRMVHSIMMLRMRMTCNRVQLMLPGSVVNSCRLRILRVGILLCAAQLWLSMGLAKSAMVLVLVLVLQLLHPGERSRSLRLMHTGVVISAVLLRMRPRLRLHRMLVMLVVL